MKWTLICAWMVPVLLRAASQSLPQLPAIAPTQAFAFAVLGDNRGDDSGQQPAAFLQVLQAVDERAPAFVLDSGDMIYGHTTDEDRVRDQWRIYRQAIARLRAPMVHIPGNHDIWDGPSSRIYRELWGATYHAFDYGNTKFIGLDTETAAGRLSKEQFDWLKQQLDTAAATNVFIFMHRPLFPVGPAIGSSLDEFAPERDRLHNLFVQHRNLIRGVFAGHEHLYNYQERDGIHYYITGGAGAPLYMAPELGGFHHFLWVRVDGNQVEVELQRVCAPQQPMQKPRSIAEGELLESWQQGLFWYAWDRTASIELTPEFASDGARGLRLNFDLAQYAWPVLALPLVSPRDFSAADSISLDAYVPATLRGTFFITAAVEGTTKHEAPPVKLKSGWNTVTTKLAGQWLPLQERRGVHSLEWSLSSNDNGARGYVIFDNLRTEYGQSSKGRATELLESWERPMLWRVFDETVQTEIFAPTDRGGKQGLVLHLDFSKCNRPVVFAQLNPPWDLTNAKALVLETATADSLPNDLTIELAFRANDVEFTGPPLALRSGAGRMRFDLQGNWLAQKARGGAEQVAFRLVSTNTVYRGDLIFRRLSSTSDH